VNDGDAAIAIGCANASKVGLAMVLVAEYWTTKRAPLLPLTQRDKGPFDVTKPPISELVNVIGSAKAKVEPPLVTPLETYSRVCEGAGGGPDVALLLQPANQR